jgi:hypothetical protein
VIFSLVVLYEFRIFLSLEYFKDRRLFFVQVVRKHYLLVLHHLQSFENQFSCFIFISVGKVLLQKEIQNEIIPEVAIIVVERY